MSTNSSFVLWGSAGHAKVLADLIHLQQGNIVALFENNENIDSCIKDVPIFYGQIGLNEWISKQVAIDNIQAAVAIGGSSGRDRQEIANLFAQSGLNLATLAHPSAAISNSATLGRGTHILANSVVAADVILGSMCIINNSANIDHECTLGDGVHAAPGAVFCGCVNVGNNTMIGAGAVILPRINIGNNVVVGAGAVVTKDIDNDLIVAGNPARVTGSVK